MAKNIQEFVVEKILEYLKERDEEINHLKKGLELTQKNLTIRECLKCKNWININRYYDIQKYNGGFIFNKDFYICCFKCSSYCCYECLIKIDPRKNERDFDWKKHKDWECGKCE